METARDPQSVEKSSICRVLITGASGYVGRRMVAAATAVGHEVVAGVRDVTKFTASRGVSVCAFDLARPEAFVDDFPAVDAVIHLAAVIAEDSHPAGLSEDINVSGTRQLVEAARRRGVRRFVFVSSQSAAEDAPSRYGRAKWAIERLLTGQGEIVVRPGMVTGGPPRGLYGLLYRLCRIFPFLPIVRPSAPVYPVHVDDLCGGILEALASTAQPDERTRVIAPCEPQRFADYVRMIARERAGQRVHLVPLPATLLLLASWITERVPWLPTVSRERVVGLIGLRPYPRDAMGAVSLPLRDLRSSLASEGQTRRLIAEGRTLMRYVLGGPVPAGAVRRYARAVLRDEDATPLQFSRLVQAWPRLFRAVEPLAPDPLLRRRLSLATRIVEMTPAGARRFHDYEGRPLPLAAISVFASLMLEGLLLPIRLIAARPWNGRPARRASEHHEP